MATQGRKRETYTILQWVWGGILGSIVLGVVSSVITEVIQMEKFKPAPQTVTFAQHYWAYRFGFLLLLGGLTFTVLFMLDLICRYSYPGAEMRKA